MWHVLNSSTAKDQSIDFVALKLSQSLNFILMIALPLWLSNQMNIWLIMESDLPIKLQVSLKKSLKNLPTILFVYFIQWKAIKRSEMLTCFGFLSQGCSREYNQPFGYLKSPGWPGHHPDNMDCSIILRAPLNHTISLFFHAFSLEDSTQCSHDFLEVSSKYTYFVGLGQNLLTSKDINKLGSSLRWTDIMD